MNYMPLVYAILTMCACIMGIVAVFFRFTVPGYMPDDELQELGVWNEDNGDPMNEYAEEFDRRDQLKGQGHAHH